MYIGLIAHNYLNTQIILPQMFTHIRSGYWQVAQDPSYADKKMFITRTRSFKFKVLPFGLKSSPGLFQRVIDLVLAGITRRTSLVYIDDITTCSRGVVEHLERLEEVYHITIVKSNHGK